MSKLEEKFREKIESCTCKECGAIYGYDEHDKMILDSAKQCVEITEQECIGFAEWIVKRCFIETGDNEYWSNCFTLIILLFLNLSFYQTKFLMHHLIHHFYLLK